MSQSQAISTIGMTLKVDTAPRTDTGFTGSEVDIGDAINLSGFNGSRAETIVTNFQSTAVEKRLGLPDFGSATIECQIVPGDAGQDMLRANLGGADLLYAEAEFEDFEPPDTFGSRVAFSFQVSSTPMNMAVGDVWKGSFELSLTGTVDITGPGGAP